MKVKNKLDWGARNTPRPVYIGNVLIMVGRTEEVDEKDLEVMGNSVAGKWYLENALEPVVEKAAVEKPATGKK